MHRTIARLCRRTSLVASLLYCSGTYADDAKIVDVNISTTGKANVYRIDVTLEHADEGWDHYANRWDVLDQQGKVIGSRTLHHPHVNEQPFTRSLTLTIPNQVTAVTIVASDSVHGDNPESVTVTVPNK